MASPTMLSSCIKSVSDFQCSQNTNLFHMSYKGHQDLVSLSSIISLVITQIYKYSPDLSHKLPDTCAIAKMHKTDYSLVPDFGDLCNIFLSKYMAILLRLSLFFGIQFLIIFFLLLLKISLGLI